MSPQETARAILAWYGGDASKWAKGSHGITADGMELSDSDFDEASPQEIVCACLVGAGALVTNDPVGHRYSDSFQAFDARFCALTGAGFMIDWNDAPERTFADVVSLLERIAAEPTL